MKTYTSQLINLQNKCLHNLIKMFEVDIQFLNYKIYGREKNKSFK